MTGIVELAPKSVYRKYGYRTTAAMAAHITDGAYDIEPPSNMASKHMPKSGVRGPYKSDLTIHEMQTASRLRLRPLRCREHRG